MTHVVILVHGTWGKSANAWYHDSADANGFAAKLKTALAGRGVNSDEIVIVPHEWTGGNTHADRLDGAAKLAEKIVGLRDRYRDSEFHLVAHSHGGNVALKGIERYLRVSITA